MCVRTGRDRVNFLPAADATSPPARGKRRAGTGAFTSRTAECGLMRNRCTEVLSTRGGSAHFERLNGDDRTVRWRISVWMAGCQSSRWKEWEMPSGRIVTSR